MRADQEAPLRTRPCIRTTCGSERASLLLLRGETQGVVVVLLPLLRGLSVSEPGGLRFGQKNERHSPFEPFFRRGLPSLKGVNHLMLVVVFIMASQCVITLCYQSLDCLQISSAAAQENQGQLCLRVSLPELSGSCALVLPAWLCAHCAC